MNIEEIKTLFKIDLKEDNRKTEYVHLKSLYIQQQRKNGKNWQDIATDLNIKSHASCINLLKKIDTYKENKLFKHIEKAFKNKDKESFNLYMKKSTEKRVEQIKGYRNIGYRKRTIAQIKAQKVIPKAKEDYQRDSIWNVMTNLRFKNTYLNDLVFIEWTKGDWIEYNKIIKQNETSIKI
jgi:hypothetical protein